MQWAGVFQQPEKPGPVTAIAWLAPTCHARARLPAGAHVPAPPRIRIRKDRTAVELVPARIRS